MQKLLLRLNISPKYLGVALLLAIPLYPKFPFIRIPGTYVSIRLEDFLLLLIGVYLVFKLAKNFRTLVSEDIEKAIFLFLGVGLLSLISAIFLTKTVVPHIGILHWLRRIEYFLPFFLGLIILKSNRKEEIVELFIKTLMLVVFVAFIYGFGQRYFSWPVIITQNLEYSKGIALRWIPGSHINSSFAGHYDLATFLVVALPVFVTSFFILKGVKTRIVLGITVACGLWLLANSVSRISIASYLMSSILALIFLKKYKEIVLLVLVSFLFLGTSSDLIARYKRIIDVTKRELQRMNFSTKSVYAQTGASEIFSPSPTPEPPFEDRSTSIRLNVEWPRAIRAFSKNPLLGTGFSSITLATDNDYLRLLGEVGILGLGAFGLIFIRLFVLLRRNFPLDRNFRGASLAFMAGMAGSLAGIALNAVFIDVFEASKFATIYWLFLGFSVALMRSE